MQVGRGAHLLLVRVEPRQDLLAPQIRAQLRGLGQREAPVAVAVRQRGDGRATRRGTGARWGAPIADVLRDLGTTGALGAGVVAVAGLGVGAGWTCGGWGGVAALAKRRASTSAWWPSV